jgi:hypothetical protein
MPRIALDLNNEQHRGLLHAQWRFGPGLVPGQPNEGLVAQLEASPARLPDYDDSGWEICTNIRESRSKGFTFAWWRIAVTLPEQVDGVALTGYQVLFETNVDNYGELWIDGQLTRGEGNIVGINAQQRTIVTREVVPGARHVIAVFVANGPLAEPRGGIFLRYATLAFETRG